MVKEKIELTLQDESGQEYVAYPFVESEDVTLSNGMDIETMIAQDVSMPIVTHEETSFKVGVGDSDISNSIVDSSVANMTIKGQTYQNILPDPTLRNSMTDGKTMQKLNEGYESVNTVDGVCKSAILSGQTKLMDELGNECDHPNRPNAVIGAYINASTGEETLSDTSCRTTYIKAPHETFKIRGKNRWKKLAFYDVNKQLIKTLDPAFNSYDDYVVNSTLIPSNAEYMRVSGSLSPINSGDVLESVLEILDVNNSSLYNTQLRSCKMPVLQTVGKNLLNPNLVKHKWYPFKLKKGTTLTLSTKGAVPSEGGNICFKDGNNQDVWFSIDSGVTKNSKTLSTDVYQISNMLQGNIEYQMEYGTQATSYEPYKTNILTTPHDFVLGKVEEFEDTINTTNGELIIKTKEISYTDSKIKPAVYAPKPNSFYLRFIDKNPTKEKLIISDTIMQTNNWSSFMNNNSLCSYSLANTYLYITIPNTTTVEDADAFLTELNPTFRYVLAESTIKTVDLSSYGNWDKVVLDGSENWSAFPNQVNGDIYLYQLWIDETGNVNNRVNVIIDNDNFTPLSADTAWFGNDKEGVSYGNANNSGILQLRIKIASVEKLNEYLSNNPITVWVQKTTSQSYRTKEMLSFSNGHVQLSSAEGSLIPSLSYEVPTSNSYQLDLAKTNTKYTMKSSSANGNFTIDGTQYNFNTNGTFTTPSTMNNKLMIANGTVTDLMFVEGDVTSKTIPYFKGIKSTFEGEDKIEVLSTGKNLFDGAFEKGVIYANGNLEYSPSAIRTVNYISVKPNTSYYINLVNLESFESFKAVYVHEYDKNYKVLRETQVDNRGVYTSQSETRFIKINTHNNNNLPVDSKMIVCKNSTNEQQYEPYKSNTTKIPLLCGTSKVSEPLAISTEFGRWKVETGEPEETNTTKRSRGAITIPENTSEICFYNNGILRAVNFHALDENEEYIEYIHSTDGRVVVKDEYKKFKIHLGTNDSSNLSCRFTTINNKALRSLPNGVCDEIILDRENNKAKIVQRVGKTMITTPQVSKWYMDNNGVTNVSRIRLEIDSLGARKSQKQMISNLVPATGRGFGFDEETTYMDDAQNYWLWLHVSNNRLPAPTIEGFKSWLSQNPLVTYYELETPIITEVDLEGFPYVYKDGHIFLNGEITPVTEIKYSINQQHQIESSSQDLIRHQKEIDYLYKLIGEYVRVDYKNTLLSLNLELK